MTLHPVTLLVLALAAASRLFELWLSARNQREIERRGGHRVRPDGTLGLVIVHSAWFIGMVLEESLAGRAGLPSSVLWSAAGLAVASEALRIACIRNLGVRWNVGVVILPGAAPITTGLHGWMRHPNYTAVVLQLVTVPLALDLPWTAAGILLPKLLVLRHRIALEDAALGRL
jgi:methyltransferase